MVASVAGGVAADYIEICETLKECSLDEILEIVFSNPEAFTIKKEESNPVRTSQDKSTPTGDLNSIESKSEPVIAQEAP